MAALRGLGLSTHGNGLGRVWPRCRAAVRSPRANRRATDDRGGGLDIAERIVDHVPVPLFYEIAALLVLAAGAGLLGVVLRQPLVVSFIAVGLLAGPSGLGIAQASEHIDLLAELGVAVLLFLVGLKLDVNLIRSVGPVAVATGLGQVAFTALAGFGICLALGLDWLPSLYVAVALTFSSTIIIVKLLSDKGEVGALHGRIALGFLIVQDVVVVLAMVVLSSLGIGASGEAGTLTIVEIAAAALGVVAAVVLFARYLATPLVERLARAPELLVSFAIGMAALLAALGDALGFGKELGGLLAGVALASTPYRDAIATRLTSLRDFLLLFFFIDLGAHLDLGLLGESVGPAAVLSLFVLIGNPLIVMAIMGAMGYRKRTGFLAGLTVAQISEFSLIFMAMGLALGHVTEQAVGLVTLVGLVTIAVSVYMIVYSHQLYAILAPVLRPFERRMPTREPSEDPAVTGHDHDVIVIGLGRYGGAIAQLLRDQGNRVLGIDFNPAAVRRWRAEGIDTVYGDIADPEFVAALPVAGVHSVVCAVREHELGLVQADPRPGLIQTLRANGYDGPIAVAANRPEHAQRLQAAGADLVLQPFRDAADQAVDLLRGARRRPAVDLIEPEDQKDLVES
jgi:Kef-type K+ transport system membrane component KefB